MKKVFLLLTIASLALAVFSNFAGATQFNVTFTQNSALQWTGVVDTATDTLSIQTWVVEGGSYWTPSTTPLAFKAYSASSTAYTSFANLNFYDVPDNWDGTIGSNWGFLSDLLKSSISWNEGTFLGNNSRLGWGISHANDGSITTGPSVNHFSYVPLGAYNNGSFWADTVVISSASAPVPEPATMLLFGIGLLGLAGVSRRKQ